MTNMGRQTDLLDDQTAKAVTDEDDGSTFFLYHLLIVRNRPQRLCAPYLWGLADPS